MTVEMINGRRVGVTRCGAGAPMLMLHCALAHRGALAPLMAVLGAGAFCAFDLPGHGESEFDARADIQAQAVETAVALLEECGPAHVVGHSFGATVALKLATLRPDLVTRLSLYEPVYFSLLAEANPVAYEAEAVASKSFTDAAEAGDWPAASRAFLDRWSAEPYDGLPSPQREYILKTIPLILASSASIITPEVAGPIMAGLPELKMPVLLMEGTESPAVIAAINDVIAARVPGIKRQVLAGAGHMGPITSASTVAQMMRGA